MNIATATTCSRRLRNRRQQRGVVAIEFALMFLFGMLPLLLFTFAGALIFAAKQSLTLAADNGARAALHYNTTAGGNLTEACSTALQSMDWLFALSASSSAPAPTACTSASVTNNIASIAVTSNCTADTGATCVLVTTTYDYNDSPLILGTGTLYGWLMSGPLQSTAVIQIYNQGS
jgi:Flp pilus assembly protein TadG